MIWGAIASVAGSLISSAMSKGSADKAADTQVQASREATQLQREQMEQAQRNYELARSDLAPWRSAGEGAVDRLQYLLGTGGTGSVNPAISQAQARVDAAEAKYNELSKAPAPQAAASSGGGIGYDSGGTAYSQNTLAGRSHRGQRDGVPGTYVSKGYGEDSGQDFVFFPDTGPGSAGGGGGTAVSGGVDPNALAAAQAELGAARNALNAAQNQPWDPGEGYGSLMKRFSLQDFEADPGYQFRRSEGQRGIENSAAARGMQLSGANLKALNRFNSGLASQEYGAAYGRDDNFKNRSYNMLSGLSSQGLGAATGQAGVSQNLGAAQRGFGSSLADLALQAGNARSAGIVSGGNAMAQGVNDIGSYLQLQSGLRNQNSLASSSGGYGTDDWIY